MKILFLTQYFYPDVASTGQLLSELAKGLSEKNVLVEVITAAPSYSYKIPSLKKENYFKVKIKRIWSFRLSKNNRVGQILNSTTFFANAFVKLIIKKNLSNLLIVSNPPFLPFLGIFLKKLKGVKFIFLIHDVFPEKAVKLNYLNQNSLIVKFWNFMDRKLLFSASKIVVLSETMKVLIEKKFDKIGLTEKEKISVIHNWADEEFIKPSEEKSIEFRKEYNLGEKFIIQYSGNLGASYELEKIIEVAETLKNEEYIFLIIGDGVKKNKLMKMRADKNLSNIIFLPYLEKNLLPYSLVSTDISLITYESKLEGLLMPSKLYTILASGKPVIALCKKGSEIDRIIVESECGFTIDNDLEEFAEKIRDLANNRVLRERLGKNARKYFEMNYTLKKSIGEYYSIIKDLYKE